MEQYILNNNFNFTNFFTSGSLANTSQPSKFISIPINMNFSNNGNEDVINKIIQNEVNATINPFVDLETIKFNASNYNTSDKSNLQIKFYFTKSSPLSWGNDFYTAGFTSDDINNRRNRLTKSFFKLDFYDSNLENNNLLFSEYLNVNDNQSPTFTFDRLFWLKNDQNFIDGLPREVYFNVTFYNAKDGTTRKFLNRTNGSAITINSYRSNPSWRYAKLKILNPFTSSNNTNSNYNRVFYVEPINGNTDNLISFFELIVN
jgi:hypothetical protein